MSPIDLHNLRIPDWIAIFVIGGILLVVIAVPLRVLWTSTHRLRDFKAKVDQFADRLRERFSNVSVHWSFLGPTTLDFDVAPPLAAKPGTDIAAPVRKVTATLVDERTLVLRLRENIAPKFPCVVRTNRRFLPPVAFVGLRLLPRIRTCDPLVDDAVAIYTTSIFGGYLREVILDTVTLEGRPSGVAESLIVLRRLPGVRSFRLWTAPEGAMTLRLNLRTDDMIFRPEEIETAVHHLGQLYDRFVLY